MTLNRGSEVDKFDRYAHSYSEPHAASVRASGEAPEFFARHKLECLLRLGAAPSERVLDYGCGTGSLTRLLLQTFSSSLHLVNPRLAAPGACGTARE